MEILSLFLIVCQLLSSGLIACQLQLGDSSALSVKPLQWVVEGKVPSGKKDSLLRKNNNSCNILDGFLFGPCSDRHDSHVAPLHWFTDTEYRACQTPGRTQTSQPGHLSFHCCITESKTNGYYRMLTLEC